MELDLHNRKEQRQHEEECCRILYYVLVVAMYWLINKVESARDYVNDD